MNPPVFPDPGDELFSSLLEEEDKPPDVFSDLSTVLVSTGLCGAMGGWRGVRERRKDKREKRGQRDRWGRGKRGGEKEGRGEGRKRREDGHKQREKMRIKV